MEKELTNILIPIKRKSTLKGTDLLKTYIKQIINIKQLKDYLSFPNNTRTRTDQDSIIRFLLENYSYFHQFHNDIYKLDKLINVLEIETYKPNETIINYGEQGNKFYILLLGTVSIYKPIFNEKEMCLGDFIKYARNVKHHAPKVKYERLKEMNNFLSLDIDYLIKAKEYQQHQSKFIFHLEDQEKINEMGKGFSFGEVALIKKSKRNATIIAQTKCIIGSIKKANYNKIIKECEEKRFEKTLIDFKQKYSLFIHWTHHQLLRLINCFTSLEVMKGQCIYKQNSDPDGIYILETGSVEMFSLVSYDWIHELYDYIIDSKTNLVYYLYSQYHNSKHSLKVSELNMLIDGLKAKAIKSPCQYNPNKNKHILLSNPKAKSIIDIKNEEEDYNDPCNLIKVLIKKCTTPEVFGFVECIEMKKRLSFVKVTSSSAIIQKVNLNDFYKLINSIEEEASLLFILDLVAKTKYHFNHQLKNQIEVQTRSIGDMLDYKYDMALTSLSKNNHWIKKACNKIKAFGKYDKNSKYYIDSIRENNKKMLINNHSDMNRQTPKQSISMNINKPLFPHKSIIRSESMSSILCRENTTMLISSNKVTKNHMKTFHYFETKPFRIQSSLEKVTSSDNSSNRTKLNKQAEEIKKEHEHEISPQLYSCSSYQPPSLIQNLTLIKKRPHHIAFSIPSNLNNCDKTSTMTTIQHTSRSNKMFKSTINNINNCDSNSLLTKELFLSRDYIDYMNKQDLKKSKSCLKNCLL